MPRAAPARPLKRWVDDELVAERRSPRRSATLGTAVPAVDPGASTGWPTRLTATASSPTSPPPSSPPTRTVRFREMEYALPRRGRARRRCATCAALIEQRGLAHLASRSRCGSPPPTTTGCRPPTAARPATSPCTATSGRTRTSTSAPSSRSCARTAGGRTGARCTTQTPTSLRRVVPALRRLPRRARPARPRPGVRQPVPRQVLGA